MDCGILLLLITNNLSYRQHAGQVWGPGYPLCGFLRRPSSPSVLQVEFHRRFSRPKQPDVHLLFDPTMWRIHLQPPCVVMMMQNTMPDTFDER